MGGLALYGGDLVVARAHLEQSSEPSTTEPPSTPSFASGLHLRITSLTRILRSLWGLGYTDQADQRSQQALALAGQVGHIRSLAYAEYFAAILYQCRRDVVRTRACAEALMGLAGEQGFLIRGDEGRILRGWALAMQGDADTGVAQIRQGLAVHQAIGPKLGEPYRLCLLAEASGQAGQPETGLQVLAEALTLVAATEER